VFPVFELSIMLYTIGGQRDKHLMLLRQPALLLFTCFVIVYVALCLWQKNDDDDLFGLTKI
jgi:hypothetical protein